MVKLSLALFTSMREINSQKGQLCAKPKNNTGAEVAQIMSENEAMTKLNMA